MSKRIVVVPPQSPLLTAPSTQVLYQYDDGFALIETDAAGHENGEGETPVRRGLQLEGVSDELLETARNTVFPVREAGGPNNHRNNSAASVTAYVEMIGPVDNAWLTRLQALGVEPLQYQPENCYLCRGLPNAFEEAKDEAFVFRVTPVTSALKPRVERISEASTDVMITTVTGDVDTFADAIDQVEGVMLKADRPPEQVGNFTRIFARVTSDGQAALLSNPLIISVERLDPVLPEDEVAGLIIAGQVSAAGVPLHDYPRWLQDAGVNGLGVTIGIVDEGVDTSHPAFSGRVADLTGGRRSWHGTFVAGHAAGDYRAETDELGYVLGLGTAPSANLIVQDNQLNPGTACAQTVNTQVNGVFGSIQNNSWGKGTDNPMTYLSDEHAYDALARNADSQAAAPKPLTICFSSGNSGSNGLTRPKAAKNILVTGNSESQRNIGGTDSDNIDEVYTGTYPSSWGNCADRRIRPHVVAPGEWTASANFDSRPGDLEYISPRLTWGGGSSGASPKTAGACALLTHWWKQYHQGQSPSPAMLRALVVNSAEPMKRAGDAPNQHQGWGRLSLRGILAPGVRGIYSDQEFMFASARQSQEWMIRPVDPHQPVKVTLAWTDPPGPLNSGTESVDAIVNKLLLSVVAGNRTYYGGWRETDFEQGYSKLSTGSVPTRVDNLQNVFLRATPASDTIRIKVEALSLSGDCLTGGAVRLQQDFALVITNAELVHDDPVVNIVIDDDVEANADPAHPDDHSLDDDPVDPIEPIDDQGDDWQLDRDAEDRWWSGASEAGAVVESSRNAAPALWSRQVRQGIRAASALLPERSIAVHDGAAPEYGGSGSSFSAALRNLVGGQPLGTVVLVVNRRMRVSTGDLALLRQISFGGDLYLLSDDPGVVAFLLRRLNRIEGIHVRMTAGGEDIGQLVQDTLAELCGRQQLVVTPIPSNADDTQSDYSFDVVSEDEALSLNIQYEGDALSGTLTLKRPNLPAKKIDLRNPGNIQVRKSQGLVQVVIARPKNAKNWAGQWTLVTSDLVGSDHIAVSVWAHSKLKLTLTLRSSPLTAESGRSEALVDIHGEGGARLSQAQIRSVLTTGVQAATEAGGGQRVLRARPSRRQASQPGGAVNVEAERSQPLNSNLSDRVRLPASAQGAAAVRVVAEAYGETAQNEHFGRILNNSLSQLQPRSEWSQNAGAAGSVVIQAHITGVDYAAGRIVSLRLARANAPVPADKTVTPTVVLGEALTLIDLDELGSQVVLLRVQESQAQRLLYSLEAQP